VTPRTSTRIFIAICAAVALLATGCARWVWTKDETFTQQDFLRDRYECERDVRQSGYFGGGLAGSLNMQDFFESCMGARGWRKVRADEDSMSPRVERAPWRPVQTEPVNCPGNTYWNGVGCTARR
jgi:hypothetical protein